MSQAAAITDEAVRGGSESAHTARDQAANPTDHTHARADAYLVKPFDPAAMIRVVGGLAGVTGATAQGSCVGAACWQARPSQSSWDGPSNRSHTCPG